jgi:hypothetical protein
MKFASIIVLATAGTSHAFSPSCSNNNVRAAAAAAAASSSTLRAEIRDASDKKDELRFGWDGTTALGGAVDDSQPARMLADIRAAGETVPDECEVYNANVEMDADSLKFEDLMELIDTHYEVGLLEFKNGNILNKQGENEGSAKLLSYAAISEFDKETTLKLWGQYYREVLADPDGDSHQNIRNFMKTGWDGTLRKQFNSIIEYERG